MESSSQFEFVASEWLNTPVPLTLKALRGKVVVVHAFQMLCPGCVSHGIPQASVIDQLFPREKVQVIGMHSVFEHHDVMTVSALKVFLSEYRIKFPVMVDKPSSDDVVPKTMLAWQLQGTPSLIIFDQQGNLRFKHFGRLGDMQVGAVIAEFVNEGVYALNSRTINSRNINSKTINSGITEDTYPVANGCTDIGCSLE